MFKQPAENTNATPMEEQRSAERVDRRIEPAEIDAEIEAEAKRISAENGQGDQYSHEDWTRAEQIVHNRKKSLSKG